MFVAHRKRSMTDHEGAQASAAQDVAKPAFEEEAGVKVTEELWLQIQPVLQTCQKDDIVWNFVVKQAREAAQLLEQVERLSEKNAELQKEVDVQKRTQYLVMSASTAAKDDDLRKQFREKQVGEVVCRGGFVAHNFFLDFVMAAQEVQNVGGVDEEARQVQQHPTEKIVRAVKDLGLHLSKRKDFSMFNKGYVDEEAPQSAVAAELFQLAIGLLQKDLRTDKHRVRVTHQQQLVTDLQKSDVDHAIIRKRSCNGKAKQDKQTDAAEKKSDDRIDVCIWFLNNEEELGACVLASVEYKPSDTKEEIRKAQADMYGSNIHLLHRKPVVIIDIAGGKQPDFWKVSAHGLVEAEFTNKSHSWEKTPLYEGTGAEAIVSVAGGLLAAKDSFPRQLDDFGCRLGPVVGLVGEYVYKAYDNAEIRNANIDVVKEFLDKDAVLFESKDKKLQIVRTKLIASDWKQQLSSTVFGKIIVQLVALHKKYTPHGDIRLANLLSSGHIIDFDFVGSECYPATLQSITQDGTRHADVEEAITENRVGDLKSEKKHDWFSMGQVMKLFIPVMERNKARWTDLCNKVESGDFGIPSPFPDFDIQLINTKIPLQGTGGTPARKQPTQHHKRPRSATTSSTNVPSSALGSIGE